MVKKTRFFRQINFRKISRYESWSDNSCTSELCVGCAIRANQQFKLRGLCHSTFFDTRFKIQHQASNNLEETQNQNPYFIGQFGWYIKYNSTSNGYALTHPTRTSLYAVYNDTKNYPMGLLNWVVDGINDNCPTLKNYKLLFTSCSYGQFTCNDGSCIVIKKRCDLISDCSDNSDEFNCQKVRVDKLAYNKNMAPVDKFSNEKRIPVTINVTELELVDIDYLKSLFVARFALHMIWRDVRLTFLNLRVHSKNLLDQHDIGMF